MLFYQFDEATGAWRYKGGPAQLASSLECWDFAGLAQARVAGARDPLSLRGHLQAAEAELTFAGCGGDHCALSLTEECERLRWFLLPQEASDELAAGHLCA